jgi:Na+-transporting methylmalonyl-CoA/oxaloacetate decarboxylase gamma subunit
MMSENLVVAFQIALVGASLVFGAIFLLWGMMAVLVRLTADKSETEEKAAHLEVKAHVPDLKQRAAAVAVAAALAEAAARESPREFPLPPTASVSAWQAVMRAQRLKQRGPTR